MAKLIYLVFLLYCFPAQSIFADGIIKEQTLTTTQGKTLNVKSDCGDVNVLTWNKDEAYVRISGNDNAKEKMEFTIKENNGDINIVAEKLKGIKYLDNINLKIYVSIPERFNVDIHTAGGDIKLGNLTGNIDMKTAGGNIQLLNVTGITNLKTAGGDINIESFSGDISAKTAGGDIILSGHDGSINAKTSGGDITVKYTGENKGIDLKTSGGNVNLYLPDNFSANIDLATNSSDIQIGFEYTNQSGKLKSGKIKGNINGGGKLITCKTSGGNIIVDKIK